MNKRDYLIRTFSRTKRKDYEYYILTAIWHKLDNMDLIPVTQQYVKRKNGRYALMDLYFPQLNIEVEVDEAYHKEYHLADKLRMDDIISAIKEESKEDFICLRIDATKTIEEINKQISEVVSIINKRASKLHLKWQSYEEELEQLKNQEYLSIYDTIRFKDIKDIANTIFGKNSKRYQRSWFKVRENTWLWCPKLSVTVEGQAKSVAGGWLNILSEDWSYIDESYEEENIVMNRGGNHLEEELEIARKLVIFAKYKDNLGFNRYRFVGVYMISGPSPIDERFIRYRRIDDKIKIGNVD